MNNCMLVGKIFEPIECVQTSNGNQMAYMYLDTEKPFKTSEGVNEHDIFRIKLWKGIAEECAAVCKVGDLVSIKGRLTSNKYKKEDGSFTYYTDVVAEKVCYLNRL